MSSVEILAQLPKLKPDERRQVFDRLCELQEEDLLKGVGPTQQEMKLLDSALADFLRDGNVGTPWREALERIRISGVS